ncbi:hypothetical protein KP509_06G005300 [Ceratopteris richardii]|uniref:4a-hydroxytetrahydrobiopterin dehydratase n=1 Tax=Ceratopteris richardii TaxID=49495 RepID=A0A8T2UPN7_CERRI|nr:hypothetical protein KP509_06G005300 [Ceratopteris richardii]
MHRRMLACLLSSAKCLSSASAGFGHSQLQAPTFNRILCTSKLPWKPLVMEYSAKSVPEDDTKTHLSSKKCVPCSANDLRPMNEDSAGMLLEQVPGWDLVKENGQLLLRKSWKVKNFLKGIELFQKIADIAETEGHHPNLHLENWNQVRVEIWTHTIGGLTENDFILAAKINELNLHEFLRKAVAKSKSS